jgi:predicted peroxiredoxin
MSDDVKKLEKVKHLFIITSEDRSGFALALAAYSASLGADVMIFLVMKGVEIAFEDYLNRNEDSCFFEASSYLDNCIELGCNVILCPTCYKIAGNTIKNKSMKKGIKLGSFMDIEEHITDKNCIVFSY